MLCKNCGTECPDGYNVCTNCGAALEASTPVETAEVFNVEEPVSKSDKTAKTLGIVSIVLAVVTAILTILCGCFASGTFGLAGIICGVISCIKGSNKTKGIIGIIANVAAIILGHVLAFLVTLIFKNL